MPLVRKDPNAPAAPRDNAARSAAELLRTGTADERWAAARALGVRSGPRAPGMTPDSRASGATDGTHALGEALKTEMDPRVREAIFTSLVRLGGQESVDAVVPYLRADDANLRMGALDALRAMIGVARQALPELLADSDADIRVICCDLARELSSSEATTLLCGLLSRETEPNVCAAAVDVLAEIGDVDALPCLRACAVRFHGATFLTFAIKIAMDRILAERPAGHG